MNGSKKKRIEQGYDSKENVRNTTGTSRKCLQDRFEFDQSKYKNGEKRFSRYRFSTSVLGSPFHPRRALKSGTDKLTKTINNVRTTFDSISQLRCFNQRLRSSTRRRTLFINDGSPGTPVTPETRSRRLLGRTPTKLYSPFGIESPQHMGRAGVAKRDLVQHSSSGANASKKQAPRCRHRSSRSEARDASWNSCCPTCTAHVIRMSLRV